MHTVFQIYYDCLLPNHRPFFLINHVLLFPERKKKTVYSLDILAFQFWDFVPMFTV